MGRAGGSILIVEDDTVDVQAVRRAFRRHGAEDRLQIAGNGEDALQRLAAGELPCLVVMDLALPRMTGIELLAEIRSRAELSDLPACILSTSRNPPEIEQAAALGVLAVFNKEEMGAAYEPLFELIGSLDGSAPNAGVSKA